MDGDAATARRCPTACGWCRAAELSAGRRAWFHEELAGHRWRISARSFFQARPDGAEALVDAVRGAPSTARCPPGGHLVDLYGGVGLFAGTLAGDGPVTLVEQSASSVADARVNLAGPRRPDRAGRRRPLGRRAAPTSSSPTRPAPASAPRPSAKVAATHAGRLVLVSCDPAALGRDARLLGDAGYDLVSCQLVDLFPHTSHVEVVSRFDRR